MDLLMEFLGMCCDFLRITYGFPWDSLQIPSEFQRVYEGFSTCFLKPAQGFAEDSLWASFEFPMCFPMYICRNPYGFFMDVLCSSLEFW